MTLNTPRVDLLTEAAELITGDRNVQYGDPLVDFRRTAEALSALGFRKEHAGQYYPLAGSDVAVIMATLKLSRISTNPTKQDSWTDLAGYAACGWENVVREGEQ